VSIHSTGLGDDERLVVSPKGAARLLDLGVTKIYELIGSGQLQSFKDGSSRKIVVASIHDYISRKLEPAA
jgi:excisionase family DNA binding protein